MKARCAMAFLAALLAVPATALPAEEIPVAVMEFTGKGGVTQEQMDSLGDLLANSIRELGGFRVIGKSDIRAVINFDEQRQLLGCDELGCASEVGGALGVRWVVVGNVSQFEQLYLVNLKLMDVTKLRIEKGISRKVEGGQAKLIDALLGMVEDLMASLRPAPAHAPGPAGGPLGTAAGTGAAGSSANTAGAAASVSRDLERPRSAMNLWGHISLWSGTGVAAFGFLSMGLALKEADAYDQGEVGSLSKTRTFTGMMWAGFAAGAALMATGLVLWLLDDGAPAAVGAAPMPGGGAGVSVVGRF